MKVGNQPNQSPRNPGGLTNRQHAPLGRHHPARPTPSPRRLPQNTRVVHRTWQPEHHDRRRISERSPNPSLIPTAQIHFEHLAHHIAGREPRETEESTIEARWDELLPAYQVPAANSARYPRNTPSLITTGRNERRATQNVAVIAGPRPVFPPGAKESRARRLQRTGARRACRAVVGLGWRCGQRAVRGD